MKRVLLLGADGAAARGVKNSLELAGDYEVIGIDDPLASDSETLLSIGIYEPDLVHAQPDEEVAKLSRLRGEIRLTGCEVFLPRREVIFKCQDKWQTYNAMKRCKVPAPLTVLGEHYAELRCERIHVRPRTGAGGKRSFSGTPDEVGMWLKRENGWHSFTAAEWLPGPTVTWQGLFKNGKCYVSQQRRRLAWTHGDRGSCLVGETYSDAEHQKVAHEALLAVDLYPHGIYGVDMTLDADGVPRVTELNIGRFFTTIEFFAQAGVNFPDMMCRLALNEQVEIVGPNPLPNGLRWERAFDALPVLCTS